MAAVETNVVSRVAEAACDASDVLLELTNISKRFPGVVALEGVDFDLRRGEVHVLFGENGAGKSTLINIIAGTYPADTGRFELGDEIEELCRLGIGKRCGGFVEDQQANLSQKCLGDLDHLLMSARQVRHLVIRAQIEIELADDGASARSHGPSIEESAGGQLTPKK